MAPLNLGGTFGRRQQQRGGSILLVAFKRDPAHVAYPPFIPPPGSGVSVRQLREADLRLPLSGLA